MENCFFSFTVCWATHTYCNGSKRVYLRRELINSLCGSLSIYRDRHRKRKRGRRRERPSGGKASHFPFISIYHTSWPSPYFLSSGHFLLCVTISFFLFQTNTAVRMLMQSTLQSHLFTINIVNKDCTGLVLKYLNIHPSILQTSYQEEWSLYISVKKKKKIKG